MPTNTTFLGLKTYNTTTDGSALFQTFRTDLAGLATTSNMNLIDTFAANVSGSITVLNAKQGIVYVPATYISLNYYEATVADIAAYATGQLIDLSLNIVNDGTVTLKINALATVSVLKIAASGSTANMSNGDLKANKEYLFRYNGTAWIWVGANSIEQVNAQGTWGNLVAIASGSVLGDSGIATISGSKIAATHIPISSGLVASAGSIIANVGTGIVINSGSITANIGSGLVASGGSITANIGSGLVASGGSIVVSAGSGLRVVSGSVIVQTSGSIITIDSSGSLGHKTSSASPIAYINANITLDEYGHIVNANNGNGITNILINGAGDIFQRQATPSTETAYADDNYCADRWILLTQTTSGCVSQQAGDATSKNAIRIKQQSATQQRVGLLQIVEQLNSIPMIGQNVCFSGKVKTSTSQTIRYAILDFGTQIGDTVVSDIVNDWTSPYYTSGSFFLVSGSCNVISSGSITSGSTGFLQFSTTGIVGTTINNLGVFVWTSGSVAQNVTVDLTEMHLELGATATTFVPRPIQQELALCQRYCEDAGAAGKATYMLLGGCTKYSTSYIGANVTFNVKKFATPTLVASAITWPGNSFSPGTTEVAAMKYVDSNLIAIVGTASFGAAASLSNAFIYVAASTSFTATDGNTCDLRIGTDVKLLFISEL